MTNLAGDEHTFAQLAERDVSSAVDMPGLPLVVLAHVHELALGLHLAGIEGIHAFILPRVEEDGTISPSDRRIPPTSFS